MLNLLLSLDQPYNNKIRFIIFIVIIVVVSLTRRASYICVRTNKKDFHKFASKNKSINNNQAVCVCVYMFFY